MIPGRLNDAGSSFGVIRTKLLPASFKLLPVSFLVVVLAAAVAMPVWYYAQHDEAQAQTPPLTPPTAFDSARAWEHLRQLVAIGPRPAGSPAIRQARAYITCQLSRLGFMVE